VSPVSKVATYEVTELESHVVRCGVHRQWCGGRARAQFPFRASLHLELECRPSLPIVGSPHPMR